MHSYLEVWRALKVDLKMIATLRIYSHFSLTFFNVSIIVSLCKRKHIVFLFCFKLQSFEIVTRVNIFLILYMSLVPDTKSSREELFHCIYVCCRSLNRQKSLSVNLYVLPDVTSQIPISRHMT